MPNINAFRPVIHGKTMFQVCYINLYKNLSPLRAWLFMTPETLFEQTWISLPQGYSMPNINAFRPVVREKKIYQNFPYFAPYWASPFIWTNLNPHPPSMFPAKFGWNWAGGSWEEVV